MDYEYIFATNLHQKLKEKIVGAVFVKVTRNDELFINIKSYGGIDYKAFISNFSDKLLNGWTTDYAMYEIVKEYRAFVLKRYFK